MKPIHKKNYSETIIENTEIQTKFLTKNSKKILENIQNKSSDFIADKIYESKISGKEIALEKNVQQLLRPIMNQMSDKIPESKYEFKSRINKLIDKLIPSERILLFDLNKPIKASNEKVSNFIPNINDKSKRLGQKIYGKETLQSRLFKTDKKEAQKSKLQEIKKDMEKKEMKLCTFKPKVNDYKFKSNSNIKFIFE